MKCLIRRPTGFAARVFLALGGIFIALPMTIIGAPQSSKGRPKLEKRSEAPSPNEVLERKVGHQLRMLAYYSVFDNIQYRLNGDRVELTGQVVQPGLKSDAEAAVKRIEGVRSVVNKIEVLPPSPNDDGIRLNCYRAIYMNGAMQKYAAQPVPSIHIIVKNGQVSLVGVVNSEADKSTAFLEARGVQGAFSVTNNLRVENPLNMTLSQTEVLNP
jgi:osmotically-inducible protein OsmY